jgi:predicted RNA polymerase sigma factor
MQTSLEETLRGFAPQVLGAVVRRFRDFGAAEDAVQEALIAASAQSLGAACRTTRAGGCFRSLSAG